MANSTQIRTQFNAITQGHISHKLKNTLFNVMPTLYLFLGKDGDMSEGEGLGRPKTAVFMTGVETAKAKKEEILSGTSYEPIIQTTGPAIGDGKVLGQRDTMPQRASWDTLHPGTYFTRPRVKWCERADPWKIPNKDIRRTRNVVAGKERPDWKAVTSLFKAEQVSTLATHTKWWNQRLWGTDGSGSPSNEDAEVWDNIHSIESALDDDNTYCGVDRSLSANAYFRGNRVTTEFTADFENIINYCKFDLGFAAKGFDVPLIAVGGQNFKKAKLEAKAKGHQLIHNGEGVPKMGQFGFKRDLVKIDNTIIYYEPELDSKNSGRDIACLNPDTWTVAIHPDSNFKVSDPFDMSKIEGGDDAQTGTIRTEFMWVCEIPDANAYFTNVS